MKREVIRSTNFVPDAAEFILRHARTALAERDQFRIALSGGNTPRPVYTELVRIGRDLPWDRIFFTFGDERCVPPEDEQSNFRMARESLFVPAAVPEKSIARMRGEIDPQVAAEEYQDRLGLIAVEGGEVVPGAETHRPPDDFDRRVCSHLFVGGHQCTIVLQRELVVVQPVAI